MRARMSVRRERAVRPQVEDAALHVVGAGLRQLDQAVGLELGLLDDALGVLARGCRGCPRRPSGR